MQYFTKFPSIIYTMRETAEGVVSDISRSIPNMTVRLQMSIFTDPSMGFNTLTVKDRDRPDTLAAELYGESRYAWVILLANNMRDWYDWPLDDLEFSRYIKGKYESSPGANDGDIVAHNTIDKYVWTLPDGQKLIVDATAYAALPFEEKSFVTVYDQEYRDNDLRRTIRVPPVTQLERIVREFEALVAK